MSERKLKPSGNSESPPYVIVKIRGRDFKVRTEPPISNEGLRYYQSILEQATEMRLRDAGRD